MMTDGTQQTSTGTQTGDGATGAQTGATGTQTGGTQSGPWHAGKIDDTTIGFWQNKGIDPADPVAVATKLTEFYRNSERFIGAPPEEMIRIPKANAAETEVNAYWSRIGVPAEAKDYDLSTVKFSDGKDLDQGFADALRGALHQGRVPKDRAGEVVKSLVKHIEQADAAELAARTATIKAQQEALDKNWGTNKDYNLAVAQRTLEELGKAAGLTPEQAKQGWDALSAGGHIGGAIAMEMLRMIGARMGEAPFIGAQPGQGANNQIMSKAQAQAEIAALKQDRSFYDKLMRKDAEATRRWQDLHKIAHAA